MNPLRRRFLGSSSVLLGATLLDALTSPFWNWKRSLLLEPAAAPHTQTPKPSGSASPPPSTVVFVDVAKEAGLNSPNVWGGGVFGIAHYNTSDITITPSIIPDGGTQSSLGKATTFDNEGLHWWDVSGAVPIRRVSQLQFNQSNSTVTQQSVDKTTVFALFDVYLPRRDLKGSGFSYLPSYVAGIGITKQPLHRLLVGVSWGPAFANFYIGAVFATQSLPTGTSCSKNQVVNQPMGASETRTCAQLSFGINIGALALQKALAKK